MSTEGDLQLTEITASEFYALERRSSQIWTESLLALIKQLANKVKEGNFDPEFYNAQLLTEFKQAIANLDNVVTKDTFKTCLSLELGVQDLDKLIQYWSSLLADLSADDQTSINQMLSVIEFIERIKDELNIYLGMIYPVVESRLHWVRTLAPEVDFTTATDLFEPPLDEIWIMSHIVLAASLVETA